MSQIQVTPETIIEELRRNISDRYKSGFPLLKELVQNADDVPAKQLDLFLTPGIPEAKNPLARDPALVHTDSDKV